MSDVGVKVALRGARWAGLAALAWLLGCGPPPVPPEPPPTPRADAGAPLVEPVPVELPTGVACVYAVGRCELGVCRAEIHNECSFEVDCELSVLGACGGGRVEKTEASRYAPDTGGNLLASPACGAAPPEELAVRSVSCHERISSRANSSAHEATVPRSPTFALPG